MSGMHIGCGTGVAGLPGRVREHLNFVWLVRKDPKFPDKRRVQYVDVLTASDDYESAIWEKAMEVKNPEKLINT